MQARRKVKQFGVASIEEKEKGFASIRAKNWGIIGPDPGPPGPYAPPALLWRFPEVKIQLGRLKLHKLRSRMS